MQGFHASWLKKQSTISFQEFNRKQEGKKDTIVYKSNYRLIESGREIKQQPDEQQFQCRFLSTFLQKEKTREKNAVVPLPPRLLSSDERQNIKMVAKFSKKYQFIWVMIADPTHQAKELFHSYYEDDVSGPNNSLDNFITAPEIDKLKSFIDGGLDLKILADHKTFQEVLETHREKYEKQSKILEIYVEEGEQGIRPNPSKKLKTVTSLADFMSENVKEQMDRSRKDVAYFNFIHSNSSPELFNRRSILQNCLFSKSQEQLLDHHKKFYHLICEDTQRTFQNNYNRIIKDGGIQIERKKKDQIERKNKKEEINRKFNEKFIDSIENCHPFENQPNEIKERISNWIIQQYCIESSIYPVLNNTIRFSLNKEKIKPVSPMLRYLYQALFYYFIEKHHKYRVVQSSVYRGSRISIKEQSQFKQGQFLWNLGFTSTSRKKEQAWKFLQNIPNKEERIKITISFSALTSNVDYLWEQEGFCCIDQISQISDAIIVDEEQVLFNPLNLFQIVKWNYSERELILKYSPHLDIIEKKKKKIPLESHEEEILQSISKLKGRSYDRGQELLEDGNPSEAVKYYEISQEQGESLTIQQKQTFINSLVEVGDIHKVDQMLTEFYKEEEQEDIDINLQGINVQHQSSISLHNDRPEEVEEIIEKNIDIVNRSLQITKIYETTEDFQLANQKAEKAQKLASKLAVKVPDRQTLLMQVRSYVGLSSVKFKVNETLSSIKQSLRSLKIIDLLPDVNFCFILYKLGYFIVEMSIPTELQSLRAIKSSALLKISEEDYRIKTLERIEKIKEEDINELSLTANKNLLKQEDSEVKRNHIIASKLLQEYFDERKKKSQMWEFEFLFLESYYETKNFKINSLSHKEDKEKMKQLKHQLLNLKDQYKQILYTELQVYETLYQNLYKTNVDLKPCLESYKNDLFVRFERLMKRQRQVDGDSLQYARFQRKYGKFLCDYGQIIQKKGTKITMSEKKGLAKIQEAKRIISDIGDASEDKMCYTYEKTQINNSLSSYYKNNSVFRTQEKTMDSLNSNESRQLFNSLQDCIKENKKMHKEDKNINKSFYLIKDVSMELQIINFSSNISQSETTYQSRLLSCSQSYTEALNIMEKHSKEKEFMDKNLNLAKLHLLMAENQARLGTIVRAMQFLIKANSTLYKALKIDPKDPHINDFNKKLLFGNKVKMDSLKLEAKLKAYYGKKLEQKQHLQYLTKIKLFIDENMNEPLIEADLNESLGLLGFKCCLMYPEISPKDPAISLQKSIIIREKCLGRYNKANGRCYKILFDLANAKFKERKQFYYDRGHEIFGKIDLDSDPINKIYSMLLETSYLASEEKNQKACQILHEDLKFYDEHKNRLIIYEVAREMKVAGTYLCKYKSHRQNGYYWLQKSLQYFKELEKSIRLNYEDDIALGKFKYQRFNAITDKLQLYEDLIDEAERMKNVEKRNKYWKQFQSMKALYQIQNTHHEVEQTKDPLERLFKNIFSKKKKNDGQ